MAPDPLSATQIVFFLLFFCQAKLLFPLTIIGSDNDLSSRRRQVIIWTNAGIVLIGALATNFSEIVI